jgi:hypothetical protein
VVVSCWPGLPKLAGIVHLTVSAISSTVSKSQRFRSVSFTNPFTPLAGKPGTRPRLRRSSPNSRRRSSVPTSSGCRVASFAVATLEDPAARIAALEASQADYRAVPAAINALLS